MGKLQSCNKDYEQQLQTQFITHREVLEGRLNPKVVFSHGLVETGWTDFHDRNMNRNKAD